MKERVLIGNMFQQNLIVLRIFKIAYASISIIQFIFIIPGIVILEKYSSYLVTRCSSIYLQYHPNESIDSTASMCENGIRSVLIIGSILAVFICFLQVYTIYYFFFAFYILHFQIYLLNFVQHFQFYFIIPIATYVNDVELMLIRKSYSRSTRYSHNNLI